MFAYREKKCNRIITNRIKSTFFYGYIMVTFGYILKVKVTFITLLKIVKTLVALGINPLFGIFLYMYY